jgi:hypothetical protein
MLQVEVPLARDRLLQSRSIKAASSDSLGAAAKILFWLYVESGSFIHTIVSIFYIYDGTQFPSIEEVGKSYSVLDNRYYPPAHLHRVESTASLQSIPNLSKVLEGGRVRRVG